MTARSRACGLAFLLVLLVTAPLSAQTVEVAPFAGYRFGGDPFALATNHSVDQDGAPAFGGTVSVDLVNGLWFEALFSHQQADVEIREGIFGPRSRVHAVVNDYLAGARQELGKGRVRPFLAGYLGLTHYGAEGDDEIRFTLGGGGGVKFPLARHLAVRLDGRVFTTFVELNGGAACSGGCIVGLDTSVVWQSEFAAGVVFVF